MISHSHRRRARGDGSILHRGLESHGGNIGSPPPRIIAVQQNPLLFDHIVGARAASAGFRGRVPTNPTDVKIEENCRGLTQKIRCVSRIRLSLVLATAIAVADELVCNSRDRLSASALRASNGGPGLRLPRYQARLVKRMA